MKDSIQIAIFIGTYLTIGLILSHILYIVTKFKTLNMFRVRDFEDGFILTIAWPLFLVAGIFSPIGGLIEKYFNKYVTWLNTKIENYKQKQHQKTQVNSDIVKRFKV